MRFVDSFIGFGSLLLVAAVTLTCAGVQRPGSEVSAERVRDHVFYLASDELEGRGAGSDGFAAAVRYVESELIAYGAAPLFAADGTPRVVGSERDSYRQSFAMRAVTVGREGGLLVHRGGETIRLPLLDGFQVIEASPAADWSGPKRVAYAGLMIHEPDHGWDDLGELELEDRCVLGVFGTPRSMSSELPEEVWLEYWPWESGIQRKGWGLRGRGVACALMMPSPEPIAEWNQLLRDPRALTSYETLAGVGLAGDEPQPVIGMLSAESAELLFDGQPQAAMPGGRPQAFELLDLEIELDLSISAGEPIETANVGALIPGTDPSVANQVILLSAHLDGQGNAGGTILNSANDNASSVAALLEASRVLTADPPRRPLVVLFPAAEERGLRGSRYFVEHPPVPFEQIGLVVNLEMVGKRARVVGEHSFRVTGRLSDAVGELISHAEARHGGVTFDYELVYDEPGDVFRNSDHVNFFVRGVPTIYFHAGRGTGTDYHRPTDDPERIDVGKVATMAEVLVELVRATDETDGLPRVNRARTRNVPTS